MVLTGFREFLSMTFLFYFIKILSKGRIKLGKIYYMEGMKHG